FLFSSRKRHTRSKRDWSSDVSSSDLGAQTLDLEALARHRGSLLGGLPDCPQPSQRGFETALYDAIRNLDPARPVFIEAESRRIRSEERRVGEERIARSWGSIACSQEY